MDETLNAWFAREILPHEAALARYLLRLWPNQDEVVDLRQDGYIRIYEAARKSRPLSPKAFLFVTARNLIIDRARRGRIVSIEALGDLDDSPDVLIDVSPKSPFSLVDLASLKDFLEERIEHEVDVLTRQGLDPYLRDGILRDAEKVF